MTDKKDDSGYAALAAKALAAAQPSTIPPPTGDRTETIAALERALRARTRRRVRPWWVLAPLVAAAAAVVVLVNGGPWSDGFHPNVSAPATTLDGLRAGAGLVGPRSVEIAIGTRLHLDAHSTATIVDLGAVQRFRLEVGGLRAEVAKLAAGRRFLIETPDAEIEVKGTRFDVAIAPVASTCGPGTRTRVAVHEGVVSVRFAGTDVRLGPGAVWPDCGSRGGDHAPPPSPPPLASAQGASTAPPETRAPNAPAMSDRHRVRASSRSGGPALPGPGPAPSLPVPPALAPSPVGSGASSTLAEQNDLLAAALAARHRGDTAEALRWLDRLLSRYPDGQLVDSARAERRRLLDARAAVRERESE